MKKFALKATVAAAGLLVSGLSFADVNLDTPVPGNTGGTYASETVVNPAGHNLVKDATDSDQKAVVSLGASFAVDKQAYVRFDLEGGKFTALPSFTIKDWTPAAGVSPAAVNAAASVSFSQGGVGESYVIFAVNPATGKFLNGVEAGTFEANGITVSDQNGVAISYRLYETLTAASNKDQALKTKTSSEFIKFAPALEVTSTPSLATADVGAKDLPYSEFTTGTPKNAAEIGNVKITHTPRALAATGAKSTAASDFLGGTNAITITGDFSWASEVTIGGVKATIAADKQSATRGGASATPAGITASNLVTGAALPFVVTVAKDTAIPATSFTSKVSFAANTGYAVADAAGGSGEVVRNGTVLKFPALSQGKNTTTFLQLVNTGALAAPMTTVCYLNDGSNVAGLSTTVAANTTYRNTLDKVCPTDTAKVQSAVLTLAVPSGNVNGTLMRKESTTGVMTYVNAASGN